MGLVYSCLETLNTVMNTTEIETTKFTKDGNTTVIERKNPYLLGIGMICLTIIVIVNIY